MDGFLSTSAFITSAARSSGLIEANIPPNLPTAVRAASTTNALFIYEQK